jgi:cytochrome P450
LYYPEFCKVMLNLS